MKNIIHNRNHILAGITPFLGKPMVKVITGMRRSGKSFLLRSLMQKLRAQGLPARNIVYVDKEDYAFDPIRDYHHLAAHVDAQLKGARGRRAICIDEIQSIEGWERIVASWSGKPGIDIIITGSSAHLLSSELATLLAGRYVEFAVHTLSFHEFMQFRGKKNDPDGTEFITYLRYGGLPGLHTLGELTDATFRPYASAIYDTIMLRDIISRHQVRNVALLDRVARYVIDNTGNLLNASRIAAFMKNQRISASVDTILTQLRWFNEAQLTERALLYDLKGKRHLEVNEKHYLSDIGLKTALFGYRAADISGTLENLVYLELRRRGHTVSVGRQGDMEIDFVAERDGKKSYYQVAYLLPTQQTLDRETRGLMAIEDNYPKYLLTMDKNIGTDHHGIHRLYIPDFLLNEH